MQHEHTDSSLEALKEIRTIMARSARFLSLSGWSGVWAGGTALVGSILAYRWISTRPDYTSVPAAVETGSAANFHSFIIRLILLAIFVFLVAFAGAFFFTWRKARRQRQNLWNNASRQMMLHLLLPLFAGGVFSLSFIYYGCLIFIAPACLAFYGLSLIGASKYTLSDIRYLGVLEVVLGCTCIYFPAYGLYFWALGFGVLHIFYGLLMWNKYDKQQ